MSFTKTHKTSTYLLGTLQKNKPTFIVLPYHFSPTLHRQQLTSCDELHVTRLQESHRNFFISNNDSSISTQVMHSSFGELTSKFRMSVLFAYTWMEQSSPVLCAYTWMEHGHHQFRVLYVYTQMEHSHHQFHVLCVYTQMEQSSSVPCVYTWI